MNCLFLQVLCMIDIRRLDVCILSDNKLLKPKFKLKMQQKKVHNKNLAIHFGLIFLHDATLPELSGSCGVQIPPLRSPCSS